ncbi:MAG: hypothetical protein CM15mP84_03680 [Cellvibrionales bacterium]|nr:MAG: hypothetical protein CM15mP84_03680 [Cellvibrionales bacterium]
MELSQVLFQEGGFPETTVWASEKFTEPLAPL